MGQIEIRDMKRLVATGLLIAGMALPFSQAEAGYDYNRPGIIWPGGGGSPLSIIHSSTANELFDNGDSSWSNMPPMFNDQWFRIQSTPYGTNLYTDSRPIDSMTTIYTEMVAIDNLGTGINSSSNYVHFQINVLASDRKDYLYDLKVYGTNDSANPYFTEGGSMRDLGANNGARIYGYFPVMGVTNNQMFAEMPFIPVSDSASFYVTSGKDGAGTNGTVSLATNAPKVVNGIGGKYWTEEGNDVDVEASAQAGFYPSHYIWNDTTNAVDQTNGNATINLGNIVGWTDGSSNTLHVMYSPFLSVSTSTDGNGTISPASLENLVNGHQTNFTVQSADEDHHVCMIDTDGQNIYSNDSNRGIQSTNVPYTASSTNGSVEATFVPSYTENGVPLTWLTQYELTNKTDGVEDQDMDEDDRTVIQEYIADTDPTNRFSFFPLLDYSETGGQYTLHIDQTSTNRRYFIEKATNLTDELPWTEATNSPGNSGSLDFMVYDKDNPDDGHEFYRSGVRLTD